ncbi:GNAT family N-acetyltransferase [Rhizobium sp. RHZ01]|uniref:GNAT family N-acetyltransferase n=1 Tax=Rhizobium sp. RHZ01 TaxID=2769304 RepID=UPI00177AE615|nr:GNAT family N-acetyltransferase [Rhizobium sp. RHZ01]MBD9447161.1 GNAT family N-acetyltransferase [Rhizobium sp. RHZ01]
MKLAVRWEGVADKSICTPGKIEIVPIASENIEGFHAALDVVARERKYLTMLEAPQLPQTRSFVLGMIDKGNPQFVALDEGRVVGWCDITRHFRPTQSHRGSLGMGIIPGYRGNRLGRRLMEAALNAATDVGLIRIELFVHTDNARAIALYDRVGFRREGVERRGTLIDGRFIDSIRLALMLDERGWR